MVMDSEQVCEQPVVSAWNEENSSLWVTPGRLPRGGTI